MNDRCTGITGTIPFLSQEPHAMKMSFISTEIFHLYWYCFQKHLSFCTQEGRGGLVPDRDPPGQRTPRQRPHRQQPPLDRDPWTETPRQQPLWDRDPLDRNPLDREPPGQRDDWTETPWTETPWTETPLNRDVRGLILLGCILILFNSSFSETVTSDDFLPQ